MSMREKLSTFNRVSLAGGLLIAVLFLVAMVWVAPAQAAPTNVPIIGEIEAITLDDPATADPYARGRIVVGGQSVIIPKNLLIDLPANRLSLWQLFDQAPAGCKAARATGLAKTDACNASGMGGIATITAVRTNAGDVIAGDVFIQKAAELVTGTVTYIDYTNGYFRLNGAGDANTGAMIRLNDPTSRHTIQQGPGCAGGPNCSADPRFTLDPDNYVITFTTGYPACIPSTVSRATQTALPAAAGIPAIPAGTIAQASANGTGDIMCPDTNRTPGVLLEPPVADSRRFAPILLGDSVTAEGNFETVGGVRFLSTHTLNVQKALSTRNTTDQPDYLFLEEVLINVAGFYNQRVMSLFIGFATLAPTDVDLWSLHRDPVTNDAHEFPLGSVRGCDLAAGAGTCGSQGLVDAGANIFKIRYDVDFIQAAAGNPVGGADAKLSPCLQLNASPRFAGQNVCPNGGTFAENFGILSPAPHEIQARTGHGMAFPGLVTLDINGAAATNGQYLFPLGLNLGGLEAAEMVEVDLNKLNLPTVFEGIPWNLDRRLGPSGCLNNGGVCEGGALGTFALDPFPYTGIEPRSTAAGGAQGALPQTSYPVTGFNNTALPNASNRIFSYVDAALGKFNGNLTLLPYAPGTLPVDPGSQGAIAPIAPVPVQCVAGGVAPVAQNDTAVTNVGVPVTILVLANDIAPVGSINFASVTIVSAPTGTALANLDGSVTFTPSPGFGGTTTFTYTVAELAFGGVSNVATVTVTVIGPPIAVNDNAVTNKNVQVLIPVLANDSAPSGTLDPASVIVTQLSTTTGTAVVNTANGTITYTPTLNVFGNDTFTYTVADNLGIRSAPATVSVIINNVNTPPLAFPDSALSAGQAVTIDVVFNDQTFGTNLVRASVAIVAGSEVNGAAIANGNGTVTFTPSVISGTGSFQYTIQDDLAPVPQTSNAATVTISINGAPVAIAQTVSTAEDSALNLTLSGTDPENTPLTFAFGQPQHGTLSGTAPNLTYTPGLNYSGPDSFTFTVSDGASLSAPATVSITVTPVNDAPTANAQTVQTDEDVSLVITPAGTDPDLDPLTFEVVGQPLHGTLSVTPANVVYTPNLNYNGPDSFTFLVSDGTVTSAPAIVDITVNAHNDPPVAVNDAAGTLAGSARTINVLANDIDVDGTIVVNANSPAVSQPANGTATVNAVTGVVTYSPNAGFTGTDTFTYTVQDNLGAVSSPATITVIVTFTNETVSVQRAEFRTGTREWRVEGTGTEGAVVTVHIGSDLAGPVLNTATVTGGRWAIRFIAPVNLVPDASRTISVETNGGATRLAFPVAVQ